MKIGVGMCDAPRESGRPRWNAFRANIFQQQRMPVILPEGAIEARRPATDDISQFAIHTLLAYQRALRKLVGIPIGSLEEDATAIGQPQAKRWGRAIAAPHARPSHDG